MPTETIAIVSVATIIKYAVRIPAKKIWGLLKWLDRIKVSMAIIAIVIVIGVAVAIGVVLLSPSATVALSRLPDDVDLGAYCGAPANGNLADGRCQWTIPDFDAVCEWQYSPTLYPNAAQPLHMIFGDLHNPSSGQCVDRNHQLVVPGGRSGVDLAGYCDSKLTNRPAGVSYDSQPVANTDGWICTRKLDKLAVCITTFQESNLVARVENGKVICYQRR